MNINQRVKLVRKEMHLSQKDFGHRLGIGQAGVSWIEQAGNTLTDGRIAQICKEFSVSENWLRTGEGEMHQKSKQDRLKEIIQEFDLSDTQAKALRILMSLPPEQRDAIAEAFFSFCKAYSQYGNISEISTGEKLADEDLIKREEEGRQSEEKASSQ